MASITLKGREIPLEYTVYEMKVLQEEVAKIGEFLRMLFGKTKEDGDDEASAFGEPEQLNAIAKCIRICGNAGLESAGMEPDLTDKWVLKALRPAQITEAMGACMNAINEGMASEIQKTTGETGPVDVTLEQMERKKEKDD